jgi:kynureninase
MVFENTIEFATNMDEKDPLHAFQKKFFIPPFQDGKSIYFCGNSLGLQSISAGETVTKTLDEWAQLGIEGFFDGDENWANLPERIALQLSTIVGAFPEEVMVANALTVNLHLLMTSFYQPTPERFKILIEGGAFPSDQYAVDSQVKWHGYLPEEAVIEIFPEGGKKLIDENQIKAAINQHADSLALVLIGGVNYFTGQVFNLHKIARWTHEVGAIFGVDLAHSIGNIPLTLHDWDVDFAVWCHYKYLNGGPGAPGGYFVHQNHHQKSFKRLEGWWGNNASNRFLMRRNFTPAEGAAAWQLSTPSAISLAPLLASLTIFEEAGMHKIREKSILLTGYLRFLLEQMPNFQQKFQIITPSNTEETGAQLSIYIKENGGELFEYLTKHGVILDWREDNLNPDSIGSGVIRIAPNPLYNSFTEIFRFSKILSKWHS